MVFLTLPSFRGYCLPMSAVNSALPKASAAWPLGLKSESALGPGSFQAEPKGLALVAFLSHAIFHIFSKFCGGVVRVVCAHECGCPWGWAEALKSPGAGVMGICKLSYMGVRE